MGIYSQNRVAGVAGNADLTMENFDFTPDFSIGSVLEAVIQMHENDARMFDTLIECDFMEAENGFIMNEAEAGEVKDASDEKKKDGIIGKIKAVIDKFIKFIQKAAGNVIAKFNDMVGSDKKIAAQYKDVLKVENLADFSGIPNFATPKLCTTRDIDFARFEEFAKVVDEYGKDAFVAAQRSKEESESALNEFKEKSDTFVSKVEEELTYLTKDIKNESWKFGNEFQIKTALELMENSGKITKQIKKDTTTVLKSMKALERMSKDMSKSFLIKKGHVEGEKVVGNAKVVYDFVSEAVKTYSKLFKSYTNALVKEYAHIRKAVILCGRAAVKASNGVKVEESAEMVAYENAVTFAIEEASDAFVQEHFEYAY